jgi:hypothetical protein
MQWFGEDTESAIEKGLAKMVDRPSGWQRITPEEAAAIRAARPKPEPEFQPSSAPMSDPRVAVLIRDNDDLRQELNDLKQTFHNFLAGAVEAMHDQKARET